MRAITLSPVLAMAPSLFFRWMLDVGAALVIAVPHTADSQSRPAGTEDARVFGVVVGALARAAEGEILVDPRVLDADADLLSVEPEDIGPASGEREAVLSRLGIQATSFLSDARCAATQGLPPAPEQDRATAEERREIERCRSRAPFTSVLVGRARIDGDSAVVRVAEATPSRYAVREFVLRSCDPGAWCVVRTEERFEIQS